jgi:hypothetical protein
MKPASVLFGSGFVGSPAQQKILVGHPAAKPIKAVSEKKAKGPPKKKCR